MDFDAQGLLDGLEGEERAAREQLLERLPRTASTTTSWSRRSRRTGWRCCRSIACSAAAYTAREIERETGLPAEHDDPHPPAARPAGARARRRACSPTRTSRRRARPSCSSTPASTRSGSPRSPACSAREWPGWRPPSSAAFVETFLKAGDSEEDVALRFATLAEQLTPAMSPILVAAFKAHLRDTVERGMLGRAELRDRRYRRLPGAGRVLRRPGRLHSAGRPGRGSGARHGRRPAGRAGRLGHRGAGPADQDDRRRGDVRQPRAGPAGRGSRWSWSRPSRSTSCPACAPGSPSGRRCIRAGDYYGNSVNLASRVTGRRPPRQRAVHQGGPRRGRRRRVAVVVGRPLPAQGRLRHRRRSSARGARTRTRTRIRRTATTPRALGNAVQVDHEDERRVRRDLRRAALGAVAEAGRDDQLAPAADLHAGDALLPARDHAGQGQRGGWPLPSFQDASNCLPPL